MGFLKLIWTLINSVFPTSKKGDSFKSMEGELIEIIKKYIIDKDPNDLELGLLAILGDPSNWSNTIAKNRLDYVIFTASNGRLLNMRDFLDKYDDKIPAVSLMLLRAFK